MDRDFLQAFLLLLTCLEHAFNGKPLILAEGRLTHSVEGRGFYFILFLFLFSPGWSSFIRHGAVVLIHAYCGLSHRSWDSPSYFLLALCRSVHCHSKGQFASTKAPYRLAASIPFYANTAYGEAPYRCSVSL